MRESRPTVERVGELWLIHLPKLLLVLSHQDLLKAIAQGKRWRRKETLAKREATR